MAGGDRRPNPGEPRGLRPARSRARRWVVRGVCLVLVLVAGLVLGLVGFEWSVYRHLATGILRSDAIGGLPRSTGGDTNILVIGLDSRLDEMGNPLPKDTYDALHAGDEQSGGYNANVLMLIHIPGDGTRATAMSIPRDDLVSFAGAPGGVTEGKIKQAYGFAVDERRRQLIAQGLTDPVSIEQKSRDAGRSAQVATVRQFLGGVPIDHFVEVTMVAFYQLAQVVQPITVCLNQDTRDSYSGANFHRGYQQINAEQALAFVRQRRDPDHPAFTDLDRERRQQAFISSLIYQLKQAGTFTHPRRLRDLVAVAKQNMVVDTTLDLEQFVRQAAGLADGQITFTTLPIEGFGTDSLGQDVNIVDVAKVQAVVHDIVNPPARPAPPAADDAPGPPPPPAAAPDQQGGGAWKAKPISGEAIPCVN